MLSGAILGLGGLGKNIVRYINIENFKKVIVDDSRENDVIYFSWNDASVLEGNEVLTEQADLLIKTIENDYDMIYFIAGLGGRMGTSLSNIYGKICRKLHKNSLGIFFYPFGSESITRRERAKNSVDKIKELYKSFILFENDYLVKYFPNVPLKYIFNVQAEMVKFFIKNFSESVDKIDIEKFKGRLGVGMGSTERMDMLSDAINEALDSPWLQKKAAHYTIIFNGNILENDIKFHLNALNSLNYSIKVKRNSSMGRRIDVLIISHENWE